MTMHKISFLQSHPIQYYSPLYDQLAKNKEVEFKIYYCSDYGLSKDGKRYHPEFGELPNWNLDLVEGHNHDILTNKSFKKGLFKGFFGLMNFSIYSKLKKDKPDILVVVGWNYFTLIWAVLCCKLVGVKIYLRGDNTLNFDDKLSPIKRKFKRFSYSNILFPLYSKICYVGENNRSFFQAYGVPDKKLVKLPHAIDNQRFLNYYKDHKNNVAEIKEELSLPKKFSLLYVGRLHKSKHVIDAIKAVEDFENELNFIIVGDGLIREELENYIAENQLNHVQIVGFKNQQEILNYYLVADALVLPSNYLETWGLVVNEAMNFNLPVILSNKVGCAPDLGTDKNGYIFGLGDVNLLASKINHLIKNPNIAKQMGVESGELIKGYSYQAIIENLIESLTH